jgi:hypothetical protein
MTECDFKGEARLRQSALPLLSVVEDKDERLAVRDALMELHSEFADERMHTTEARVLRLLVECFVETDRPHVLLRDIAERFNAQFALDYGGTASNRWIGSVIRRQLRLTTQKSNGVYVVTRSEWPKIEILAQRFGIERKS